VYVRIPGKQTIELRVWRLPHGRDYEAFEDSNLITRAKTIEKILEKVGRSLIRIFPVETR